MTRNILLTTLDAAADERSLRYYSAQNEYDRDYCEALQSMEASTKYILARFPIDEILVIGDDEAMDVGSSLAPSALKDAKDLYSADSEKLSPFDLYRCRIAQYIDEISLEQQTYEALIPQEERGKFTGFVQSFLDQHSKQEVKRLNRFFDELASSRTLYAQFREAFFSAVPEARRDSRHYMKWVNNYLYQQLKPSAKLEILPANEKICVRFVPASMMGKREAWDDSILGINQNVVDGREEINLFVSLDNASPVDGHLLLDLLDIVVSTPGSHVHLKKIYRADETADGLAGKIVDDTAVSRSANLVAAAHAFLNYSKTDMLVDFWENCGEHNDRISSMIYAARHVDLGVSMCNISEMQQGIQRLRELFRDERPWSEDGAYGPLFGVIAGCIKADYKTLLEGHGGISFLELIKWAYRHKLYQQALTLIESHAPASLVKSGIFYYCDSSSRQEEVTRLLALQRLELKSYEYYKMDEDIAHYFIKNYDRGSVRFSGSRNEDRNRLYAAIRAQSIAIRDPEKIYGCTACSSIDTVQDVLYAYYHLGAVRNKISHADEDAMAEQRLLVSESDISSPMIIMCESIEFFITSYEKALAETKGKNAEVVLISPDRVRSASERIRRERFNKDKPSSGK